MNRPRITFPYIPARGAWYNAETDVRIKRDAEGGDYSITAPGSSPFHLQYRAAVTLAEARTVAREVAEAVLNERAAIAAMEADLERTKDRARVEVRRVRHALAVARRTLAPGTPAHVRLDQVENLWMRGLFTAGDVEDAVATLLVMAEPAESDAEAQTEAEGTPTRGPYFPYSTRRLLGNAGRQDLYRFVNGYGASVVGYDDTPSLREFVVIRFHSSSDSWVVDWTTPVASGVLLVGTEKLEQKLAEIEALPRGNAP